MVEISVETVPALELLLERIGHGENVVITRRGRPVATLVRNTIDKRTDAEEALARLRAQATAHGGPFDWAEWKDYRNAGRS